MKLAIESILKATNLASLQVTKMEGAKNAFRIRVGDYRIGFYLENDTVILSRILNRKEIYQYFPK